MLKSILYRFGLSSISVRTVSPLNSLRARVKLSTRTCVRSLAVLSLRSRPTIGAGELTPSNPTEFCSGVVLKHNYRHVASSSLNPTVASGSEQLTEEFPGGCERYYQNGVWDERTAPLFAYSYPRLRLEEMKRLMDIWHYTGTHFTWTAALIKPMVRFAKRIWLTNSR